MLDVALTNVVSFKHWQILVTKVPMNIAWTCTNVVPTGIRWPLAVSSTASVAGVEFILVEKQCCILCCSAHFEILWDVAQELLYA